MEHISKISSKALNNVTNDINVSNDNIKIPNNVNNDTNVSIGGVSDKSRKYSLNRHSFIPQTPETQLAEKIASSFDDLQNYAFYLKVVNDLGESRGHIFWRSVQEEIKEKKDNPRFAIRDPRKYFAWKYKNHIYE